MTEPWLERWQEGRIGWHEPAGNKHLRQHWTMSGTRVLVPLCGKTPDLLWLEGQGNDVTGVELSEIAAAAFFTDNELTFDVNERDGMRIFTGKDCRIRIVCGDFFDFRDDAFDALYDRASLIALPANLRPAYAEHCSALLAAGAYHLLVSLDYDQALVKGPPFAVADEEVLTYWPKLRVVGESEDIDNAPPRFRQAGVATMREKTWLGD